MRMTERKVFIENIPTDKDNYNKKQKNMKRKTFLDDQEHAEKIKQNISSRRNYARQENDLAFASIVTKPTKEAFKQISFQNLQNIQIAERDAKNEKQLVQNEEKITKLRQKLQELYQHYQSQSKYLGELKSKIIDAQKLKKQNETLSGQISKIRNMVKQVLLVREKSRLSM